MNMAAVTLPEAFAELEPFAGWALPTEGERYAKRMASTLEEMDAFYQAVLPLVEPMMQHLDGYELGSLDEPEQRLMQLLYSFMTVSWAVEVWGGALIPDSHATYLDKFVEPAV